MQHGAVRHATHALLEFVSASVSHCKPSAARHVANWTHHGTGELGARCGRRAGAAQGPSDHFTDADILTAIAMAIAIATTTLGTRRCRQPTSSDGSTEKKLLQN